MTLPDNFLTEETRNGYTIPASMKEAWAVQMDLFEELLRVCDKHGLRVFADAGTLIGAVRHQGFIPWDDDIDTVMLRADYDRLMELADEFGEPYFLQTIYTDSHYTHRHAQLRRSDTAAWCPRDGKRRMGYNQGIFIDIFVLDAVPNHPRALRHHLADIKRAQLRLKVVSRIVNRLPESLYQWCRNHTRLLSDKYWYARYEEVMRRPKMDDPRALLCAELTLNAREPFKRIASYDETVWLPFESMQLPCPAGYDEVLRVSYGEYMKPVKAPSVHGEICYDAHHSYLEILK